MTVSLVFKNKVASIIQTAEELVDDAILLISDFEEISSTSEVFNDLKAKEQLELLIELLEEFKHLEKHCSEVSKDLKIKFLFMFYIPITRQLLTLLSNNHEDFREDRRQFGYSKAGDSLLKEIELHLEVFQKSIVLARNNLESL